MTQPRLFENGKVYFVTFRTEEGLPFVCIPLINEILWSCIAKAQALYPQEIIGLGFEPNHGHMILKCCDPEQFPSFVGYIKQESAHAVNDLLEIRKHTIWAEGYHAAPLLDPETLIEKLAYSLMNPYKDRLVAKIEDYKGVNSWKLFQDDISERPSRLIARSSVEPLKDPSRAWKESEKALQELYKKNRKTAAVKFSYYSWKSCFSETEDLSDAEVRKLMLAGLRDFEEKTKEELSKLPVKKNYTDKSKESMLQTYRPKKFSRKALCLSRYAELCKDYRERFFRLKLQCKEVYLRWKQGDLAAKFPAGMFAPRQPRVVNMVPIWEQGFI